MASLGHALALGEAGWAGQDATCEKKGTMMVK